ncbi:MAG: hypothetical protein AAF086_09545 [Planctomycetota bacterium]
MRISQPLPLLLFLTVFSAALTSALLTQAQPLETSETAASTSDDDGELQDTP